MMELKEDRTKKEEWERKNKIIDQLMQLETEVYGHEE
jgi:hypothetical protein